MKRAFQLLTFTICLAAVSAMAADPIPPAEHRRLELAVSEYLSGKTQPSLAYFSALAASGSDTKIEAVDEYLAEKKLPPLAQLLAQARLKAIHNGAQAKLPRPRAKEILLELPVLVDSFDSQTSYVRQHPLLNRPLSDGITVNEYERQLRTVQALFQSVTSAQELASALASLVKYVPPAERARFPAERAEMVKRDYHAEAERLQDLLRTLAGMDAALRVRRLQRAELALAKGSPAERLLAAHTWQEDSGRMDAFFATFKKGFHADGPEGLAELSDPALPGRVHDEVERCRGLAGGLTNKVNELFTGLDLWVRGRYGEGPDVFGLAKAENSIDDRDAAHDLYLPLEPAQPTDPAKPDAQALGVPHYARRHFHWWAWENQQLATGQVFGAAGLIDSNLHLTGRQGDIPYLYKYPGGRFLHWGHFRFTYAAPDDATLQGVNLKILSRLVGYVEYEQALDHFQRFLTGARPDELKAADELVRERGELAIYINLSRFIEPPGRREAEQPSAAGDTFERRGLEWVIGLARLEHQAMLVGFTANPSPLVALLPPPRPGEAYTELLVDGARMHYWAWRKARDQAKGVLPEGPDLISEARRAALILEFLQAAQARAGGVLGAMAT